jgi:hypothetical protein
MRLDVRTMGGTRSWARSGSGAVDAVTSGIIKQPPEESDRRDRMSQQGYLNEAKTRADPYSTGPYGLDT